MLSVHHSLSPLSGDKGDPKRLRAKAPPPGPVSPRRLLQGFGADLSTERSGAFPFTPRGAPPPSDTPDEASKESDDMQQPIIAGIDEAGRGCLAGPVVAGACILPKGDKIPYLIQDSKALTAKERDWALAWILQHCHYGVGCVDAGRIDTIGILSATEAAMQQAVFNLSKLVKPTYLLIDGRDKLWFDIPHSSIIRGDQLEQCIAAASIIAKVTRDRLMLEAHKEFPLYNFASHKGYGTSEHFQALEKHGTCTLHRKTFLKKLQS